MAGVLAAGMARLAAGSCAGEETGGHARIVDRAAGEAERILVEAGSALAAARSWVSANLSAEQVDALARRKRAQVEEAIAQLVVEAHTLHGGTQGLFVYKPGWTGSARTDWARFGDVALRPSHAVLLVHGLDEPGDIWNDLAPKLDAHGFGVVRLDYPNDQAIAASGDRFVLAMIELRREGIEEVSIVAHSMGGLIVRDALTRSESRLAEEWCVDPSMLPRVRRVVTVGTPYRGSALACLRSLAEVRDHFMRWTRSEGRDARALLGFLSDGSGEAGRDLMPGSAYLTELNARAMPLDVPFTVIIGRLGPAERDAMDAGLLDSQVVRRVLGPERAAALRDAASAALDQLGDGVVPVESARLEGAKDSIELDADHRSMLRGVAVEQRVRRWAGQVRAEPPAIPIILDRLLLDEAERAREGG